MARRNYVALILQLIASQLILRKTTVQEKELTKDANNCGTFGIDPRVCDAFMYVDTSSHINSQIPSVRNASWSHPWQKYSRHCLCGEKNARKETSRQKRRARCLRLGIHYPCLRAVFTDAGPHHP